MKKLALTSAVAIGMCLGSISTATIAKDMVIGASMSKFSDKWLTYLIDGINQFDKEHDDVKIIMTDANDDPARMVNQIENFIDQGVDAVIIHPTDRQTVRPIARKLKRAGIPLVVVNRRPNDEDMDTVSAYVGSDETKGGQMQGEAVVELLKGQEGRVGILMGLLGLEGQINRTAGNKEIFDKHDNIKVLVEQEGKWDRAKGLEITEDWLQGKEKLNVIVSNNDEMAIGAVLATRKAGFKDEDFIIVGLDGTPDALDYLGKGLDITVFQDGNTQGYDGAKAAYNLARGEKIEKTQWVPFKLITPENKQEFVPKK
ncbi:MAG: sugar ABC transporter substrate-binding protein [Lautropia sp.]|nr:sugar ABC transporter substrate-binding protein [Lautropia sp.]